MVAQERLGETLPFAWIESVRDETRGDLDLVDRRLAGDFLGDLLRRFDDARAALRDTTNPDATGLDDGAESLLAAHLGTSLDVLYGHERARRYLRDVRPSDARLADLLDEAEAMVADRLGGKHPG